MDFADLFVAATLGAVLAVEARRRGTASLLVVGFGMAMGLFLFVADVLPGTVPVALALVVEELRRRRASGASAPFPARA
jgi:H+/gluconate symporter-like permease